MAEPAPVEAPLPVPPLASASAPPLPSGAGLRFLDKPEQEWPDSPAEKPAPVVYDPSAEPVDPILSSSSSASPSASRSGILGFLHLSKDDAHGSHAHHPHHHGAHKETRRASGHHSSLGAMLHHLVHPTEGGSGSGSVKASRSGSPAVPLSLKPHRIRSPTVDDAEVWAKHALRGAAHGSRGSIHSRLNSLVGADAAEAPPSPPKPTPTMPAQYEGLTTDVIILRVEEEKDVAGAVWLSWHLQVRAEAAQVAAVPGVDERPTLLLSPSPSAAADDGHHHPAAAGATPIFSIAGDTWGTDSSVHVTLSEPHVRAVEGAPMCPDLMQQEALRFNLLARMWAAEGRAKPSDE